MTDGIVYRFLGIIYWCEFRGRNFPRGIVVVNERAELAVAKVVEAVCERSEQAGNDFGMRRAERAV